MSTYTVIGFYADTEQRFADVIRAETSQDAEIQIQLNNPGVVVVGTVCGAQRMADIDSTKIRYDG